MYSKPCQISNIELLAEIFNSWIFPFFPKSLENQRFHIIVKASTKRKSSFFLYQCWYWLLWKFYVWKIQEISRSQLKRGKGEKSLISQNFPNILSVILLLFFFSESESGSFKPMFPYIEASSSIYMRRTLIPLGLTSVLARVKKK